MSRLAGFDVCPLAADSARAAPESPSRGRLPRPPHRPFSALFRTTSVISVKLKGSAGLCLASGPRAESEASLQPAQTSQTWPDVLDIVPQLNTRDVSAHFTPGIWAIGLVVPSALSALRCVLLGLLWPSTLGYWGKQSQGLYLSDTTVTNCFTVNSAQMQVQPLDTPRAHPFLPFLFFSPLFYFFREQNKAGKRRPSPPSLLSLPRCTATQRSTPARRSGLPVRTPSPALADTCTLQSLLKARFICISMFHRGGPGV